MNVMTKEAKLETIMSAKDLLINMFDKLSSAEQKKNRSELLRTVYDLGLISGDLINECEILSSDKVKS